MNRIILIGNGFDLAHGLKTGYKDFIDDFCVQVETNDEMWGLVMKTEKTKTVNFETLLENEENFKNKFFYAVKKDLNIQNWVDVEKVYYNELVNCMKNAEKNKEKNTHPDYTISHLNEEFGFFEKRLKDYLSEKVVQKDKEDPTEKKDKKKDSIVTYLNATYLTEEKEEKYDTTYIVNFNYTDTDQKYADEIKTMSENECSVIRLHGTLNDPKNPMIFGYGDELAKNYKELEELDDNRYLEYVKSIKYSLTDNYYDLYSFINGEDYHIYLFGLSCGNSDRTLLNELFEPGPTHIKNSQIQWLSTFLVARC